jgi:hypothetical protein
VLLVADPLEKAKHVTDAAAHPVETVKDLAAEAERGRSPRTPLLVLTGVTLVLGVIFAILVTIALILYFVYGGK